MRTLGVDVGGTSTRVALFEEHGGSGLVLIGRAECPTNTHDAAEAIVLGIRQLSESGSDLNVSVCGIGLPEYVRDGTVMSSMVVEFGAAEQAAVERELGGQETPSVLRVDSDVRCAALAEWHAAEDPNLSLLYISVGTGLSSTLVLPRGELLQGASGAAISLGEWPAPHNAGEPQSVQGNLEQFASGHGIENRYEQATGASLTARQIAEVSTQDSAANAILREAGAALGDAVRRLFAVLDPGRIVIGGGLGSARTPLWNELELAATAPIPERFGMDLRQAVLGPHSGELGAALMALSAQRVEDLA